MTRENNEPAPSNLSEADQTRLRHLLETQKYAVLATDNHGQPYTSLMAYSITDDLRAFILMTERGRLKYENLMFNPRVAIMIDNRENLGACRTLVVDSENRPRRGRFLPDSPPHGYSMGQETGKKGTGAVDLQPTIPKSDRLLGSDLEATIAVTAQGVAEEISGDARDAARALCLARHPALQSFADSPSCAFIRIQVTSYLIVRQFQDVTEWRIAR